MYRITVKSQGKYNNCRLGPRYCFRKKTAKYLIKLFYVDNKCDIDVEKFVRISDDVFCWTDDDEDSVFRFFDEVWEEE